MPELKFKSATESRRAVFHLGSSAAGQEEFVRDFLALVGASSVQVPAELVLDGLLAGPPSYHRLEDGARVDVQR